MKRLLKKVTPWAKILLTVLALMVILGPLASFLMGILSIKTFTVNPTLEQDFRKHYLENVNTTSKIAIKILSSYDSPKDTDWGELVKFAIYNQANEPVEFPEYGLRIFTPDDKNHSWVEVKKLNPSMDNPIIIMPNGKIIDSFGNLQENYGYLAYANYPENLPPRLRFYITGVGQKTHQVYAAYVDLLLNR
jgi:hypothetical protein